MVESVTTYVFTPREFPIRVENCRVSPKSVVSESWETPINYPGKKRILKENQETYLKLYVLYYKVKIFYVIFSFFQPIS